MKSLNQFKSNLSQGLAKTSLMDVVILPPKVLEKSKNVENLRFKCQSADLPGKTFGVDERKDYVITSKHPYGMTFTDLSLTFICTSSMEEREFFDSWMDNIIGNENLKSEYYDNFISDRIMVNLYTGRDESEKSCTFHFRKIFTTTLAAQNVSWMNEDVLKLTITFSYEYWTVEYFKNKKS